jgi:hypothetical protein
MEVQMRGVYYTYMLSKTLALHEKVFTDAPEKVATRIGFGDGLLEAGQKNPAIVGLCADLTEKHGCNRCGDGSNGEDPIYFIVCNVFSWKKLGTNSDDRSIQ